MRRGMLVFAVILASGCGTRFLFAQASGAHVDGIVRDAQGLALPHMRVTLTETQTALERTVETSAEGAYQFVSLNPGQYKLSAALKGFDSPVRMLVLEVNQYVRLDLVMHVGPLK